MMDEQESLSMTQVGAVFLTSFISLMIYQVVIGAFLDEWVYGVVGYFACNAWCQKEFAVILGVIPWIWFIIKFAIASLFIWLLIMAIKRQRYTRQPDETDSWTGGGFDMYR